MTDASPDELKAALANWRDKEFATLIVVAVQLAVEKFPEELRKALASVYSQTATEKYLRHINSQTQAAADYANQCRELCQQVSQQVSELEGRLDRALEYLERLRGSVKSLPVNGKAEPQPKVKA